LVERACQCGQAENSWEENLETHTTNRDALNGKGNDDARPFEERFQDEELIKSLLCSEELPTSLEENEGDGSDSDEVESPPSQPETEPFQIRMLKSDEGDAQAALDELKAHRHLGSLLRITHQKLLQDAASVQKDISQNHEFPEAATPRFSE
jgi:hypothetical protein